MVIVRKIDYGYKWPMIVKVLEVLKMIIESLFQRLQSTEGLFLECISQFSKAEIFKLLKKAIYFVQEKHYIKLK